MNGNKKLWLSVLLAGVMVLNSAFLAFASQTTGPAGDPRYNPSLQESETGTEETLPPETNADYGELPPQSESSPENDPLPATETSPVTEPTETQAPAEAEPSTETEDGLPAEGETQAPETEAPETEAPETEAPETQVPETVPGAVSPQPQMQTTLLLSNHAWSQTFINDQWCDAGQPFYSVSINMAYAIGNVHYRTYTSNHGWTSWAINGQQTDIPADFAPVEAIQIRFSGPVLNEYDLYYTTRLTNGTEPGWAKNGATAGVMDHQGSTLAAIRMAFFRKADPPDIAVDHPLVSANADGIQYVDGVLRYLNGDGSNHSGWGWVEGQRYFFADSYPVTGWQYIDGYKYYFDEEGKLVTDLEPIIGAQGPFLIKINKQMNTTTVYAADGANGYIIPVKSFLCSTGDDTPLGTFHTPEKYRWRLMNSGVSCQYATRLGPGLSFLLHSIIYSVQDINTMHPDTYNYLGVARSAGCIRFTSGDAKWIYDHCPIGTTIQVYNSPVPGPFERPTIKAVIPTTQHWDPTDPLAVAQFGGQ